MPFDKGINPILKEQQELFSFSSIWPLIWGVKRMSCTAGETKKLIMKKTKTHCRHNNI